MALCARAGLPSRGSAGAATLARLGRVDDSDCWLGGRSTGAVALLPVRGLTTFLTRFTVVVVIYNSMSVANVLCPFENVQILRSHFELCESQHFLCALVALVGFSRAQPSPSPHLVAKGMIKSGNISHMQKIVARLTNFLLLCGWLDPASAR